MYNRMNKFFSDNNLIYSLQFGFRQKYSTAHALISLTENIRKNLDEGNIGCGIFVDFQKAFDTVEHDTLLSKVEHPQRSVLGSLLFLIYINDLNQALKFCKVHHFADDASLIHFSKSVYRLNKYVNLDLKHLTY